MAASTINIAEFRSVPHHHRQEPMSLPDVQDSRGWRVVAVNPALPQPQVESETVNPSGIFDIEAARNRQNLPEPGLYRPFAFRRRANLVRLNEPHVAVMPVPVRSHQMAMSVDDCDLPPAA